jgi:PsbP
MKILQLKTKLSFLAVLILMIGVSSISAQETRYVSSAYNVAFQIPKNSSKSTDSTEKELYFEENGKRGGLLQLSIDEETPAEYLSQILSSNTNRDALVQGFIKGLKEEIKGAETTILEKKEIKVIGLSSYKIVTSIVYPNIKLRVATFFIPFPEHKRMYIFNITALDSDFERWHKIAEASVNSFEILKPKGK